MTVVVGTRLGPYEITGNHTFYNPGRDGQRFLVRAWLGEESEPGFLVTMNGQALPKG